MFKSNTKVTSSPKSCSKLSLLCDYCALFPDSDNENF
nr:MAG TPA: hypothetical protein [Caudoviricetes sp.]